MTPFKTFRGFLSPVFRTGIAGIVQPGVGVEPNHVEMGGQGYPDGVYRGKYGIEKDFADIRCEYIYNAYISLIYGIIPCKEIPATFLYVVFFQSIRDQQSHVP